MEDPARRVRIAHAARLISTYVRPILGYIDARLIVGIAEDASEGPLEDPAHRVRIAHAAWMILLTKVDEIAACRDTRIISNVVIAMNRSVSKIRIVAIGRIWLCDAVAA